MPNASTRVTPGQLAAKVGVTVRTVERWAARGDLPPAFVTPGGRRRWDADAVDEWIASRTAA